MQKAIEGLDSYDESVGQNPTTRDSFKTLQTSPVLRHQCKLTVDQWAVLFNHLSASKSSFQPKPTFSSNRE